MRPGTKRIQVDNEITLATRFGTPDSNSAISFLQQASS
jgi:hypothetical protein